MLVFSVTYYKTKECSLEVIPIDDPNLEGCPEWMKVVLRHNNGNVFVPSLDQKYYKNSKDFIKNMTESRISYVLMGDHIYVSCDDLKIIFSDNNCIINGLKKLMDHVSNYDLFIGQSHRIQ